MQTDQLIDVESAGKTIAQRAQPLADAQQPLAITRPDDPAEMSRAVLGMIASAASDPRVDVSKMEKLLEMQLQVMARAAEVSFNNAFARLQQKLPRITKNGIIDLGNGKTIRYARFEDIHDAVAPLMFGEGFTVSFTCDLAANDTLQKVTATLRHRDGHHASGSVFLPLTDPSGAKNKVQGSGSIVSYGKRYSFCQLLNIVTEDEDDDGMQAAAQPISADDQKQIRDLIRDSGADVEKFLALMGVKAIEEILTRDLAKAMTALQQKLRSKPIDAKQQGRIRDLLADTGVDEDQLLLVLGAKSIEEIPAKNYEKAIAALKLNRREK